MAFLHKIFHKITTQKLPLSSALQGMKKHLVIVPRWGGTPEHDWYPWITKELNYQSDFLSVQICNMPNPETPTIAEWTDFLLSVLSQYKEDLDRVVLVGHSVGCHAVLHALQKLNSNEQIDSAVFVAGWWSVDSPWESILPWIHAEHNFEKIRLSAKNLMLLLSNNDPFTADYKSNATLWESRLSCKVLLVKEAKHFNAREEPEVLSLLKEIAERN